MDYFHLAEIGVNFLKGITKGKEILGWLNHGKVGRNAIKSTHTKKVRERERGQKGISIKTGNFWAIYVLLAFSG